MDRIYLDHAATTPLHPTVREAMLPWLGPDYGNPSSLHAEGRRARAAVDEAREKVAAKLGCDFGELIFTSSGTEAMNLAILGAALGADDPSRRKVLISAAEHHAALHTAQLLPNLGFEVVSVRVDRFARIDLEDLQNKLGPEVLLVAAMHANNELGTLQPIAEVSRLCRRHGALYLCDAVQTFKSLSWNVDEIGADMAALSAHKIYGPKGVGALFVRAGTKLQAMSLGGGQERELRAGTENVPGIVGFGAAVDLEVGSPRLAREAFLLELAKSPGWVRTVPADIETLPGHAHLRFPGLSAESMLIVLDRLGVAASSGAACSSGSLEPSHVLLAAGYTEREAAEGLRFTFGSATTEGQAREAASRVLAAAEIVRGVPTQASAN
jgi:cysteine desulfurase